MIVIALFICCFSGDTTRRVPTKLRFRNHDTRTFAVTRKFRCVHALHFCQSIREIAGVYHIQVVLEYMRSFWQEAEEEIR